MRGAGFFLNMQTEKRLFNKPRERTKNLKLSTKKGVLAHTGYETRPLQKNKRGLSLAEKASFVQRNSGGIISNKVLLKGLHYYFP